METVEARTSGSGWEIASTMSSAQEKKKNPEDGKSGFNFKNALQSFTLDALCSPPTIDGLERTCKSAKGTSHSSKKSKRNGNEENELDRAALAEIRSNSSRKRDEKEKKKRKRVEEKTTRGENLDENQQRDDMQPREKEEQEKEERQKHISKTTDVRKRFFAMYGDDANAHLNEEEEDTRERDVAEKEKERLGRAVAVTAEVKEKEDEIGRVAPPATKISYANMRKETVPGTVQIISASGKKHIVSSTKGWSEVRINAGSKTSERIKTAPIFPIPTSTRVPDEANSCGIFSTGSGRTITFKNIEKSLAKGRALLSGPDVNGEIPSSPYDVTRSQYLSALNSKRVEDGPLDYHTPINSTKQIPRGGGGGLGSIFSTGNGKTMRVSEASLEKGRMMLESSNTANKTPMNPAHLGTSAQTMSEKRPSGFPLVEREMTAPNSAPSAMHSRAARNHHYQQQRHYQNISRMDPEQHRPSGVNAFTPPVRLTRTSLQKERQTTLNHLPTHDLFKSRIRREPLSKYFHGALPFSNTSDAYIADVLASRLTFDSAQEHRIDNIMKSTITSDLDVQSLTLGWRDIRDLMFTRGAKEKHLSEEWCANAYRHVVWTAASLKRAFGGEANQALSAKYVLERMMYRYEREINLTHRPILRKILERDSPSTVPMILLVSAVRSFGILFEEGEEEEEEEEEEERVKGTYKKFYPAEIEMSDGWYSVRAVLDDELSSHLRADRIRVGSKMFVQNCQLSGIPDGEGVQPLKPEAYKARLVLRSNSCRPCEWDAKLGLQRMNLTVPLSSIRCDGGDVPRVLLKISRHFPPVYRERAATSRDNDGKVDLATPIFVTRREESETAERKKFEIQQRRVIEKAVNKDNIENEIQDMNDYEEAVNINRTADFERQRHSRQEEVKLRALEEAGIPERRDVSRVCKILVNGLMSDTKCRLRRTGTNNEVEEEDNINNNNSTKGFDQAVVTAWETDEAFSSALEEGSVYAVTHLKSSEGKDHARQRTLHLSTTKHTRWTKIPPDTLRNAGLQTIEKSANASGSYLDCLVIHLFTGPRFVENGGRRFAQWMFFVEIQDNGSIDMSTELFALKVSSWDEEELQKNCAKWTNVCQRSRHHCVILRNITRDGLDERNRVKKSSTSVEVLDVVPFQEKPTPASTLMITMKAKHLSNRFDRFQNGFAHKTRDYVKSMKDRATSLVNNSSSTADGAVASDMKETYVQNKEPTLSQFTPPRVQFEDERRSGEQLQRRSSIRLSDSDGWGGSQFHGYVEECLQQKPKSANEKNA